MVYRVRRKNLYTFKCRFFWNLTLFFIHNTLGRIRYDIWASVKKKVYKNWLPNSFAITKNVEKVRFALRGHKGQQDQRHDGLDGMHIYSYCGYFNQWLGDIFQHLRNGIFPSKLSSSLKYFWMVQTPPMMMPLALVSLEVLLAA